MARMEEHGIEMRPTFYPMHIMPPYFNPNLKFPVAEMISNRGINLPTHALLKDDDIKYIVDSLIDSI